MDKFQIEGFYEKQTFGSSVKKGEMLRDSPTPPTYVKKDSNVFLILCIHENHDNHWVISKSLDVVNISNILVCQENSEKIINPAAGKYWKFRSGLGFDDPFLLNINERLFSDELQTQTQSSPSFPPPGQEIATTMNIFTFPTRESLDEGGLTKEASLTTVIAVTAGLLIVAVIAVLAFLVWKKRKEDQAIQYEVKVNKRNISNNSHVSVFDSNSLRFPRQIKS